MKYLLRFNIIICLLIGLTACGFHLRGHMNLPKQLRNVYIQSNTPYGEFEQTLTRSLRNYSINVVDSPSQADTILNIVNVNLAQSAGATSADLQTRQYTLSYNVTFQLLAPSKTVILSSMTASSSTMFTAELSQMVTSSNTTSEYKTSLENEVIFRMVNLLTSDQSKAKIKQYFAENHR